MRHAARRGELHVGVDARPAACTAEGHAPSTIVRLRLHEQTPLAFSNVIPFGTTALVGPSSH